MAKTLGSERHRTLVAMFIAAREKAEMTQTDLARHLGAYQSFVARLESGQRRVDVIELIELADILGFDAPAMVDAIRQIREAD